MPKLIFIYGGLGGLIVGLPLIAITMLMAGNPPDYGVALGYTIMLIALSMVFAATKRYRDQESGGVIRFWAAFGLGLAVSLIASAIYVLAWEITLQLLNHDFAAAYADGLIAQQKASGVSGEALDKFIGEMEAFKVQYANPLYRLPMTFTEIFPVGILVSLISAGLLSNHRFLPAKRR
jgi:hypothetical protein